MESKHSLTEQLEHKEFELECIRADLELANEDNRKLKLRADHFYQVAQRYADGVFKAVPILKDLFENPGIRQDGFI